MTTTLEKPASILTDLRTTLTENIAKLQSRLADIAATGISEAEQFRVLRADCGMMITLSNDGTYRLVGTGDGMSGAFRASAFEAKAVADAWNSRLTREQMTARCWVEAIPIQRGLEIAIDEAQALLDNIPA